MLKTAAVFAVAIALLLAGVTPAPAIAIISDALNFTCVSGCATVFDVTSPPIPPWQDPTTTSQPTAKWISQDANSGASGNGILNGTTVTFRFSFTALAPSSVNLNVWADDTSGVTLDGALHNIASPNAGPFPVCATTPIGCTPGTEGVFNFSVGTGPHTLDFDFSQLGGDGTPMGLLVAGDVNPVPEPATILLIGSALAAAGVVSRRRFRKSEQ